uniref:Ras-GEF domain-containing protein n=1 Tax=Arcella intermedia TaxID=1963864 RepID=A0A6B2KZ29_9EUKA
MQTATPKLRKPVTNRIILFQRSETNQASGKMKDKAPSYREIKAFPSSGNISPRTRNCKNISEVTCEIIAEIYNFVNSFADSKKSYMRNEPKSKPDPKNEAKEKECLNNFLKKHEKIADCLKEAVTNVLKSSKEELGLESIRAPLIALLNKTLEHQGTVLPTDPSYLARGQYLRYAKQQLLRAIFFKSETLFYACSQFLSVVMEFKSSDSHCYHLMCLAVSFSQVVSELMDDVVTYYDLLQQEVTVLKNQAQQKKLPKYTQTIWNEVEDPADQKKDGYRPGTLNNLVIRIIPVDAPAESDFVDAFFSFYDLFADSKEVWRKVEDRYFVPKQYEDMKVSMTKMRVTKAIVRWLKVCFQTIDTQVLGAIEKFADKTLKRDKFTEIIQLIKRELDVTDRFAPFSDVEKNIHVTTDPPKVVPMYGLVNYAAYEIFMAGDPKTIADQITLLEFDIFVRINKSEITAQRWSKEKYHILSRNVISLVKRSNKLAYFVACSILFQKKLKDRSKVLKKIVKVAHALAEMKNFNGLMGVLMGLTLGSVSRLKHTWAKMNPKLDLLYKQLANFQDPSNSFKFYRDSLKAAGHNCCFPYFCTFLSDLTFMDEGNPDFVEVKDTKLINFQKYYLLNRTIKQVQLYQSSKFELEVKQPYYTFLNQMPELDEKALYALSTEREPRDITLRDLELREKNV